jgi:hypothetical protein
MIANTVKTVTASFAKTAANVLSVVQTPAICVVIMYGVNGLFNHIMKTNVLNHGLAINVMLMRKRPKVIPEAYLFSLGLGKIEIGFRLHI